MASVNDQNAAGRLGPDFVAEHRLKFGKRPPQDRQLTYDIAVEDRYESWQQWLDDQFAQLPAQVADNMARQMWKDKDFWPVNFELAAGAGLRAEGLIVAYEQVWGGLTPDWTVLSEDGKPLGFVEVHTDMPATETFARMRAWHGLVERIKAIPVPVLLQIASNKPLSPPDARTARKIAQDLKRGLTSDRMSNTFRSEGYTFLVMHDPDNRVLFELGMHACLEPPSSLAGPVSAERLMERVEAKVSKYRELADAYGVPLIVAVGAHRFTGVTLQHVKDTITGLPAPKMTFQFSPGDAYIGEQKVTMAPVPAWKWPQDLAGLLWIENELPFRVAAHINPDATRQMPRQLLPPDK
jgi:hypothetical protein